MVGPPSTPAGGLLAPGLVEGLSTQTAGQLFPGIVEPSSNRPRAPTSAPMGQHHAAGRMAAVDRPRLTPLAPRRFALQLTMSQELHDKLRYAQELLGHQVPSGDLAEVLERALDALIPRLEKRKFAATDRPHHARRRSTADPRSGPAHVKRAVWERDGGRCTFVSDSGRRCPARTRLEFDHLDEVARGGQATVGGMRLRCRAHNQHGAERTFGVEFMRRKRDEARCAAAAKSTAAQEVCAREFSAEARPGGRERGPDAGGPNALEP